MIDFLLVAAPISSTLIFIVLLLLWRTRRSYKIVAVEITTLRRLRDHEATITWADGSQAHYVGSGSSWTNTETRCRAGYGLVMELCDAVDAERRLGPVTNGND